MIHNESAVEVKEFPETLNAKRARLFLSEMKTFTNLEGSGVVLDFSKVHEMNRAAILLLLCCLEEAMKNNGDVKLAAIPSGAMDILKTTGVGRLFETFDTNDDALRSFRSLPLEMVLRKGVQDCSHQTSEKKA